MPWLVLLPAGGDLDASYQDVQGTQDPRVVWDPHTEYFYNFAYGRAVTGGAVHTRHCKAGERGVHTHQ